MMGAGLMIGGVAVAATMGMTITDSVSIEGGTLYKVYDEAPNVVCYVYKVGEFGSVYFASSKAGAASISCLKNN